MVVHVNRVKLLSRRENKSNNTQNNPERVNETVHEPQNTAQVVRPEFQQKLARFSCNNLHPDEGLGRKPGISRPIG